MEAKVYKVEGKKLTSWCDLCGVEGVFGSEIDLVPEKYWHEQTKKVPWQVHLCKNCMAAFIGEKVALELMKDS